MTNIDNMQDVIDSRGIIARIKELESERDTAKEYCEENGILSQIMEDNTEQFLTIEFSEDNYRELATLKALAEECAYYSSDWQYGEVLIRRSYFEEYMDQMVEDCYELPKDMPYWMSIKLDYDALKQDYSSVDYDGVEYLIRSV